MKVVLFQPASMRQRCLDKKDLQRLQAVYNVVVPETDNIDALAGQWQSLLRDAQVVMTGWESPPISDAMLNQAPLLRFIMHGGGSIKLVVPPTTWDRGIRVASCNEALGMMVAEATLGMIITGLKGIFPANAVTHGGGWKQGHFNLPGFQIKELYDVTIGIIGASKTGRHLIQLLQPFEVDIAVADPTLSETDARRLGVRLLELDELMAVSDVVTLHAPALPQTRRMLGQRQFKAMRDGTIFINTARGCIVDEAALAAELETGRIWAFIDVTDPEPPAVDHPFRRLPNVILMPHIAGATANGCRRLGRSAVDQLLQYASGHPINGEITADRLAILA